MERHCQNALGVAKYLQEHSKVDWVNYPGLPSHPSYELARKYMPKGQGALIGFGIKGGRAAGRTFIDSPEAVLAPGEHRRREVAGDPPGYHHPLAADAR